MINHPDHASIRIIIPFFLEKWHANVRNVDSFWYWGGVIVSVSASQLRSSRVESLCGLHVVENDFAERLLILFAEDRFDLISLGQGTSKLHHRVCVSKVQSGV